MKTESPYPRNKCPKCGAILVTGAKWCPECGYALAGKQLSNGCVILLLFAIGYPLLSVATCTILIAGGSSSGIEELIGLFFPVLILTAIAYYISKNRKPGGQQ